MTEAELREIEAHGIDIAPVPQLIAEVRRLRGLHKRLLLKWEPHGGPHAAAEACGLRVDCICGLVELEDEALK